MTCRTCGGLVIDHYDESKCINCGRSPEEPVSAIVVPEKVNPLTVSDSFTVRTTMGKWSPEAREAHKQRMKDAWAKKRKGGGSTAVVPARPTMLARSTPTIDAVGGTMVNIEEAIARLRDELTVLERAKEILER